VGSKGGGTGRPPVLKACSDTGQLMFCLPECNEQPRAWMHVPHCKSGAARWHAATLAVVSQGPHRLPCSATAALLAISVAGSQAGKGPLQSFTERVHTGCGVCRQKAVQAVQPCPAHTALCSHLPYKALSLPNNVPLNHRTGPLSA